MLVCKKCGEPKPDGEFLTKKGEPSKRCNDCRAPCPDCAALAKMKLGPGGKRRKVQRCQRCRDASRPPGWPEERFPIKRHAVARYHERVRPDIGAYVECLRLLLVAMEVAEWSQEPPGWYAPMAYAGHKPFQRGYLMLHPGVIAPLSSYGSSGVRVSTVLTVPGLVVLERRGDAPAWVEKIHDESRRRDVANTAKRERRAARRLALYPPVPEMEVGKDAQPE